MRNSEILKRDLLVMCFKRFLEKKGVFEQWVFYLTRNYPRDYLTFIKNNSAPQWLSSGFSWSDTDEKYAYWSRISNEWGYIVRKFKIPVLNSKTKIL